MPSSASSPPKPRADSSPQSRVLSGPAAGEGARLTEFEAKVIAFFVETAGVLGTPKSVAMIYGVLFGSAEPLTFSEIEQKLGISKGSVSQGLRALRELGAVRVAQATQEVSGTDLADDPGEANGLTSLAPDARQRAYVPVVELRLLLTQILKEKIQPHLKSSSDQIDALDQVLTNQSTADTKILDLRMKHLRVWRKRARQFLPLVKAFLQ